MTSGKVKITLISADLTHDTETFGSMDPFVTLTLNNDKKTEKKTKIYQDSGKKVKFDAKEVFTFDVAHVNHLLHFQVFEEDNTSNDFVGDVKRSVAEMSA